MYGLWFCVITAILWWEEAISIKTCNTAAVCSSFFFFIIISLSLSITWLNFLCGFLFRFLVFALLKTWSVMSKLSKPTGDRRGDVRGSHPSGPHKVNTAHKQSRPAEDREPATLNSVYFTTELSSTYSLSHLQTSKHTEFTLLFISDTWMGRRKYPKRTKQSTICLPLSWDLNPNIGLY